MSASISELPGGDSLDGSELIPAVQLGADVATNPFALANFMAEVPDGVSSFRVLNFGGCCFDPNNNESINLVVGSYNSSAIAYCVQVSGGGTNCLGLLGARAYSGLFVSGSDNTHPFSFESINGLSMNNVQFMDHTGNLLDHAGHTIFNLSAGQQAAIANSTGTGDVVARLNSLLAALRNLGLIAT
jgi:hypothetical protein